MTFMEAVMRNTLILVAFSMFTLALGAVLDLNPAAYIPGIIGIAIGATLLKAGNRSSEGSV